MGPTRKPADRRALEGYSTGATFMAFFGAIWAFAGAPALGGAASVVSLVVSLALAAALLLGAARLRRAARGLPVAGSSRDGLRRISRRFNLVFGLQGVAIALAVFLLVRYGLGTFVPVAVAFIVGAHFFPLAELFRLRAYHATGATLCAVALVAALVLEPASRLPFVGLGSAAVLFATSAYVLYLGGKAREGAVPTDGRAG